MIHSIHKKMLFSLERMNMAIYVCVFVALKVSLTYLSNLINVNATGQPITKGFFDFGNIYVAFFSIVILAPLLETYLVQYLFFKNLTGRLPQWAIIVLSALVFGVLHHYNIGYVLYAFLSGLLLSISYSLRLRSNPFVCTALIHSVYNLVGFVINNGI